MKITLDIYELEAALLKYYPELKAHTLTCVDVKGGTTYEPLSVTLTMVSNNKVGTQSNE